MAKIREISKTYKDCVETVKTYKKNTPVKELLTLMRGLFNDPLVGFISIEYTPTDDLVIVINRELK